jgi:formylglycine-generating enzyme required for sulfatase activity
VDLLKKEGEGSIVDTMDLTVIRQAVSAAFGSEFVFSAEQTAEAGVPTFLHPASKHLFRYLSGAQYSMGFSEQEEKAALALGDPIQANLEEMRPVQRVVVPPFLIAVRPVWIEEVDPTNHKYAHSAAYLGFDAAQEHCRRFDMELATEAQWEYGCRAGSTTLFTWGDTLPTEEELTGWMTFNFTSGLGRLNGFGLAGLFVGEWCAGLFTPTLDSPPESGAKARVVRGGAAYFWPWQDDEWAFAMSAMRMPSTDLPDNECGFRFVRNLPR